MTAKEIYFLKSKGLNLYLYTDEDLNTLFDTVKDELESRQNVRNKQVKLELATKVENETGNDQHLADIKQELHLARKQYAERISNFDEQKYYPGYVHYNQETGLPYNTEDEMQVKQAQDAERLKTLEERTPTATLTPIAELTPEQRAIPQRPQWEISTIDENGNKKILGYS